ncbi:MAG: hypothetical protein LBE56_14800 [Tannerella sp.]|nr:hypothetical protein [Tannerella sp.]
MSTIKYVALFLVIHLFDIYHLAAQDDIIPDWRKEMEKIVYTPRYFGANAFPISELNSGRLGTRWELEVRGEYHDYEGDKTKDIFARLYIPIAKGKAGVEIRGVIVETYKTDEATKLERHAAETSPPFTCTGDLIVTSYYRLLQSDRWLDIMVSGSLKTASGNRLADARYTDAASYWFDMTAGRNLWQTADKSYFFRLQGMIGFYCWMTNDMIHRQNDALLYGFGGTLNIKNLSLSADCSGFDGYKNNGDRPMIFRSKLNFEYKKNILSLRYNHGIKDFLYDTYSIGLIRCF